jgi:hypothetical protein
MTGAGYAAKAHHVRRRGSVHRLPGLSGKKGIKAADEEENELSIKA